MQSETQTSDPAAAVLEICLVQISESPYALSYLPYTAGLLQAYAQRHAREPGALRFRPPLFERLSLERALAQLAGVQVAAFSCYCWNIRRSLLIAEELKRRQPQTLIIFGGPSVPQLESESFLRAHPFIDVAALGEGEKTFLALLEDPEAHNWDAIPGISWLAADGSWHSNAPGPRITDLDTIPSPYLSGVFAPLIQANPDVKWIATWETNRGCPFQCSFCDWGGLVQSRVYQFSLERVLAEIEWFGVHGVSDIFSADANFGMLARDLEIARSMVSCKQRYGAPHMFLTQMAKNVKVRNLDIQRLLAESGLNPVVAIALQSLHPDTLSAIRRQNISTDRYQEVQQYCQSNGIFNYTDLILGLPGETYDSFADGLAEVIRLGQHNRVMFWNAALLPNAEMGSAAYRQAHGIQSTLIYMPAQAYHDEVREYLEIIIATSTLSREDWVRTQTLAWLSNVYYFVHKSFQLLFLLLHQQLGLSFRELIEPFSQPERLLRYPHLRKIQTSLENAARLLQQGFQAQEANQAVFSQPGGKYFAPDGLVQFKMVHAGLWPRVCQEAGDLLLRQVLAIQPRFEMGLFQEALKLSEAHFYNELYGKQQAFRPESGPVVPQELNLNYNLWDFYQASLKGQRLPLRREPGSFAYVAPAPSPTRAGSAASASVRPRQTAVPDR
ncbi:MAG: radical SAM protein [Candidatus Sericytochromatia bacterium]